MDKYVKDIFARHTGITMNRKKATQVIDYVRSFRMKDENTISFLGSGLIGVYDFIWREEVEGITWLDEILEVGDYATLRDDIHALDAIEGAFHVSGKPINQSHVWIAHLALNSTDIPDALKQRVALEAMNMLQYKFLSSIHTPWFKHGSNEAIALATYESLNRKWGLRKYGNWEMLLQNRSETILSKSKGNWRHVIEPMDDDNGLVRLLNDTQGRIKSVMGNLMGQYKHQRALDARISSSSKFTTVDGEAILKEHSDRYVTMRERIVSMADDPNTFIDMRLVDAVVATTKTVNARALKTVLDFFVSDFNGKRHDRYVSLLEDCVVFIADFARERKIPISDIPTMILQLSKIFRSSRAGSPELLSIRDRTGKVVSDALKTKSENTISSLRIGLILYITLRAIVIK